MATSTEIATKLNLKPHPEGGYFSETFRDSSILLPKSQLPPRCGSCSEYEHLFLASFCVSRLHRIPCAETWHFYLGEPITVVELSDDGQVKMTQLGSDLIGADQRPQSVVPPNVWFGSFPTKDVHCSSDGSVLKAEPRDAEKHYSLVGCTCAPVFQFEDFELAKRSELVSSFPEHESLITLLSYPD